MRPLQLLALSGVLLVPTLSADEIQLDTRRGDEMIAAYFRQETENLASHDLTKIRSLQEWTNQREQYRRELLEMLGLDPWPEKTPLQPVITGSIDHDDFLVENLHFQSRPGLYVTGNLYRPKTITEPLPAVLYVCGHGRVVKDGVSFGAKANYQHHGAWFARNGYVCLTIDTLQLGEIEGIHHGTYRYDRWWWFNRGYTPAGVEAWNCVRALDYLETREEVDSTRLGVTGRSGGGAYSWWIAAIDERIKTAVPVAGITDLQNHVVDGTVEGHCDCMFMLNTYRWDYPKVAALVAPRALLISNSDSDGIFPLDGVVRTFQQVRHIYSLYGAADRVALNITAGPHKDTQELRIHAFRWLNLHLRDEEALIELAARKLFEPEQLKVFEELPRDELNTQIDEHFVPLAAPPLPQSEEQWRQQRAAWLQQLREKSFRGWPTDDQPLDTQEAFRVQAEGLTFRASHFTSQGPLRLTVFLLHRADLVQPELTVLNVLDEDGWTEFLSTMRVAFEQALADEAEAPVDREAFNSVRSMLQHHDWCLAYVPPRGIGPTAWDQSERKQIQHRRRFYLLGQTLGGMRVYDVRRAVSALQQENELAAAPLWIQSHRQMAGVALYASLFEPEVRRLDLYELPGSHRQGPFFLNVRRYLDIPQAVAMAAEHRQVILYQAEDSWNYPQQLARQLGWDEKQLLFRQPPLASPPSSAASADKAEP